MNGSMPSSGDDLAEALIAFSEVDWESCADLAKHLRDDLSLTQRSPQEMLRRAVTSSSRYVVAASVAASIRMSNHPARAAARFVACDSLDELAHELVLQGVALWMSERTLRGDACITDFFLLGWTRFEWMHAERLSDLPLIQELIDRASQGPNGNAVRTSLEATVYGLVAAYLPYRLFLREDAAGTESVNLLAEGAQAAASPVASLHDRASTGDRAALPARLETPDRVAPSGDVGTGQPLLALAASQFMALELPLETMVRLRSTVSPRSLGAHAAGERTLQEIFATIRHTELDNQTKQLLPDLIAEVAVRTYKRDPSIVVVEGDFEFRAHGDYMTQIHEGDHRRVAIDARRGDAIIRLILRSSDVLLLIKKGGGSISAATVVRP